MVRAQSCTSTNLQCPARQQGARLELLSIISQEAVFMHSTAGRLCHITSGEEKSMSLQSCDCALCVRGCYILQVMSPNQAPVQQW